MDRFENVVGWISFAFVASLGIIGVFIISSGVAAQFEEPPLETVHRDKWVDRNVLDMDEATFKYNLTKETQNGWEINYIDDGKVQFVRKDMKWLYRKERWHDRVATKRLDEFGEDGWELVAVLPALRLDGPSDTYGEALPGRNDYYFKRPRQSR